PRDSRSELDLDVDVCREVETHQRIDCLRCWVDDVNEALMGAHLEVLAAVLVLMRRANDAEYVLFRRQRHRAHDRSARAAHRVDDLARRTIDDLVVVGLEPDADLLSRHVVVCHSLLNRFLTDPRARACRLFADNSRAAPEGTRSLDNFESQSLNRPIRSLQSIWTRHRAISRQLVYHARPRSRLANWV